MIGVTRQLIEHAMKTENQEFSSLVRSADAKEALTAFLEKPQRTSPSIGTSRQ
jgi:hypothetical protein